MPSRPTRKKLRVLMTANISPAHWTTTRLGRRSPHHNEPTVVLNRQLIKYHFTGIRRQCSLFHRFLPETTRACHSSTAFPPLEKVPNEVHQM